jgi:hypothetical protein
LFLASKVWISKPEVESKNLSIHDGLLHHLMGRKYPTKDVAFEAPHGSPLGRNSRDEPR